MFRSFTVMGKCYIQSKRSTSNFYLDYNPSVSSIFILWRQHIDVTIDPIFIRKAYDDVLSFFSWIEQWFQSLRDVGHATDWGEPLHFPRMMAKVIIDVIERYTRNGFGSKGSLREFTIESMCHLNSLYCLLVGCLYIVINVCLFFSFVISDIPTEYWCL